MSEQDTQSVEQARELVTRAADAQSSLATFTQKKIDEIVGAMARAALEDAARLGEQAQQETGYGVAADKATKNRFSAETIYNFIKPMRTVGVLRETESIVEVASPRGVVAQSSLPPIQPRPRSSRY
jgi:acetaldehyde dehydrogenase (acetylating)